MIYESQGKHEDAITALLKVRYVFRNYDEWMAKSYLELGKIYEQLKEPQRAQDAYRRAVRYERVQGVVEEARSRLQKLERR